MFSLDFQLFDAQRGMDDSSEMPGCVTPPPLMQQGAQPGMGSRHMASSSPRPMSPAPDGRASSLPASLIYKMSCEYFSWPLLEPQVGIFCATTFHYPTFPRSY